MNRSHLNTWVVTISIVSALLSGQPIAAQVIPDNTLPAGERSQVTGDANAQIDGGMRRGGNLFHSFQSFSVPTGGSAFFNNAANVQNIFSRVTGESVSNIDGLIRANGRANLFLLNPNGILFGPNASLNIGGSFVGTTADAIGFPNGEVFSSDATQPLPSQLLTVNPNALFFNQLTPQPIVNQSTSNDVGLQVPLRQNLLLVGGPVQFDGGRSVSPGSHVELGSVGEVGTVGLSTLSEDWQLSIPARVTRADVLLRNGGDINVKGDGGGIQISAQNIDILGSSLRIEIPSDSRLPATQTGDLELNATGSITIRDSILANSLFGEGTMGNTTLIAGDRITVSESGLYSTAEPGGRGDIGDVTITAGIVLFDNTLFIANTSQLTDASDVFINARDTVSIDGGLVFNTVEPTGSGNGGDINITTGSLALRGTQLLLFTLGQGNVGDVNIDARDIVSINGSLVFNTVEPAGSGNGGDINITTGSLFADEAQLALSTSGKGDSGNVNIDARDTVSLNDSDVFNTVESTGSGNGGDINITTGSLALTQTASLILLTRGQGNVGDVNIDARDTVSIDGIDSLVLNTVEPTGIGNGGDINITTGSLALTRGAQLLANTSGQGNASDITINARDQVSVDGESLNGVPSTIYTRVQPSGVGQGGDLVITTGSLSLTNGGAVNTATDGRGNAGRVIIQARDFIQIRGRTIDTIDRSGIFTSATEEAVGSGGDVAITTGSLSVSDQGRIITNAEARGSAGNIQIQARDTVLFDGGDAISTLDQGAIGRGGDIDIVARSLTLLNGAQLSTSTRGQGNAGNVTINAHDTVSLAGANRASASAINTRVEAGAVGDGGQIEITSGSVSLMGGAQLATTTLSRGRAGNISINAEDRVTISGTDSNYADRIPPLDDEISAINAGSASGLYANTEPNSVGQGGNIRVATSQLTVEEGGRLVASTAGQGDAGNIRVRATDGVRLSGTSPDGFSSGLLTNAENTSTGRGGAIRVNTDALQVEEGAVLSARSSNAARGGDIVVNADTVDLIRGGQLLTTAFSSGNAGDITVNADDRLHIADSDSTFAARLTQFGRLIVDPVSAASGLFTNTEANSSGAGGAIALTTESLSLLNGGRLVTSTAGQGNAGDITVNSSNLRLSGATSGLFAQTATDADAGNLTIQPQGNGQSVTVQLQEGAQISASTSSSGRGGTLTITAPDSITLTGSGSIISAETGGTGTGGNLTLQTGTLNIQDQAEVTVSSSGQGSAGSLFVDANQIFLNNEGRIRADTSGGGGDINLRSPLILLRNGSNITTNATGNNVPGGNITVDTGFLVAVPNEDSNISANSQDFRGGNVSIDAIALYGIQPSMTSTPLSDITATGATSALPGTIDVTTGVIDPTAGLVALPTDLVDASQLVAQGCPANEGNSFVVTGRGGLPPTPEQQLDDSVRWGDRRRLVVSQQIDSESGGEEDVETQGQEEFVTNSLRVSGSSPSRVLNTPTVEATGWQTTPTGEVVLVADTSNTVVQNSLSETIACNGR